MDEDCDENSQEMENIDNDDNWIGHRETMYDPVKEYSRVVNKKLTKQNNNKNKTKQREERKVYINVAVPVDKEDDENQVAVKVINSILKLIFEWIEMKSIKEVVAEEDENEVVDPLHEPIRK